MFELGPQRYQPHTNKSDAYAAINQRTLALVVGMVATGLPIVLFLASHNPFGAPYLDTCFRYSISHFYYAPFWGTLFTGALVFIGAYLVVYKGEDAGGAERRLSNRAGLAAFGIALFPTSGWGCKEPLFTARPITLFETVPGADVPMLKPGTDTILFELFPYAGTLHHISATVLFSFLAWFALSVFTAVEPHQRRPDGSLTKEKATRNAFYYAAGGTIVFCILAMALSAALRAFTSVDMAWWDAGNWTFWFEAIALIAFGTSWLVKGRLLRRLDDTVSQAGDRTGAE